MSSYAIAVERLHALGQELAHSPSALPGTPGSTRRKFDLDQMRLLADALGHPERKFRSVLIAGTNGKGSTAATLASILQAGGYRTGLYTSPHLTRVNERIQIGGVPITDDDFARLYFQVEEVGAQLAGAGKLPQHPSFFETITAMAFLYFAEQKVDMAVLEVGMGGRLDATNIVEPLLSVITDISIDHTEWLGPTLTDIAHEKAGILRPSGVLVTLSQHPEANQVLGEVAMELGVTGVDAARYLPPLDAAAWSASYPVTILDKTVELTPPLAGTHQHRNVALAVATAVELCNRYGYKLTAEALATGVRTTRWPGRLERFTLSAEQPEILLDVAHNPAGAWTLRSALSALPQHGPRTLVFGCMHDKPVTELVQILFPIFDRVILTSANSPRAASVEELLAAAVTVGAQATMAESPLQGLQEALSSTPATGLVVVSGSIYLVGPVREYLMQSMHAGQALR
ncbi:MAG TPA: folylpolyglutamate synthase/dihydrofolate synthase family protein [Acidobacteriaceae bacterium]|nr:folylpolyglutamate synthase/dihydrofolate synthase family protein [Acidobacteriaceae bacterium]